MAFDFKKDPFLNFEEALKTAQLRGIPEHNAMSLATVSVDHKPSCRIVLFKGMIRGGFSFYTNYHGRKGHELLHNPFVASTFYWPHLDLQIRIEGQVDQLSSEESDRYFHSRPVLSQLGAWASNQSEELKNFDEFDQRLSEFKNKYQGLAQVPRPPHWGGFRLVAHEIEFWFGKMGRLHERYVYQRIDQHGMNLNSIQDYQWKKFLRFP